MLDELFSSFLLFSAIAVVAIIIGRLILVARRHLNKSNQPTPIERQAFLAQLALLQREGKSFTERLDFLQTRGLRRDVAEGLITDSERKQKADINSPKGAKHLVYSFQYPGNWKITPLDNSLDKERFFCIESLCSAMVTISLLDGVNTSPSNVEEAFKDATKKLDSVVPVPITSWGTFIGEGKAYQAKVHKLPAFGKFFRWRSGDRAFSIITICLEEDREDAEAGLALVESSFKVYPNS